MQQVHRTSIRPVPKSRLRIHKQQVSAASVIALRDRAVRARSSLVVASSVGRWVNGSVRKRCCPQACTVEVLSPFSGG